MARITTTAPARALWYVKGLCGTHEAGRRDAAVLYLPHDVDLDSEWRSTLLASLESICTEELPPFVSPLMSGIGGSEKPARPFPKAVSPLARGIGTASDPGGGVSFGQALCAAVASASAHAESAARFHEAALDAITKLPGMDTRMPALIDP